jgi:7-cyano-7-deazaguanine synthase
MSKHQALNRAASRRAGSTATILLSGGIDSSTCLAYYLREGFSVDALVIDYGQVAARRELRAAKAVSRHYRVGLRSLTLAGAVQKSEGLIVGRNALLLFAGVLEFQANGGVIAIGIHSGTEYRDCSPTFVREIQRVVDTSTAGTVQIGAPFLDWTKADVWSFAQEAKVPLSLTYSCERGVDQPCGSCGSCRDLEALRARSNRNA